MTLLIAAIMARQDATGEVGDLSETPILDALLDAGADPWEA